MCWTRSDAPRQISNTFRLPSDLNDRNLNVFWFLEAEHVQHEQLSLSMTQWAKQLADVARIALENVPYLPNKS